MLRCVAASHNCSFQWVSRMRTHKYLAQKLLLLGTGGLIATEGDNCMYETLATELYGECSKRCICWQGADSLLVSCTPLRR
jgi:hypothetical protein